MHLIPHLTLSYVGELCNQLDLCKSVFDNLRIVISSTDPHNFLFQEYGCAPALHSPYAQDRYLYETQINASNIYLHFKVLVGQNYCTIGLFIGSINVKKDTRIYKYLTRNCKPNDVFCRVIFNCIDDLESLNVDSYIDHRLLDKFGEHCERLNK